MIGSAALYKVEYEYDYKKVNISDCLLWIDNSILFNNSKLLDNSINDNSISSLHAWPCSYSSSMKRFDPILAHHQSENKIYLSSFIATKIKCTVFAQKEHSHTITPRQSATIQAFYITYFVEIKDDIILGHRHRRDLQVSSSLYNLVYLIDGTPRLLLSREFSLPPSCLLAPLLLKFSNQS